MCDTGRARHGPTGVPSFRRPVVPNQLDTHLLKETAGDGSGYTDLQHENVSVLRLAEDLALPVQHCQGFAIVRTDPDREMAEPASNAGLE